MEHLALEVFDLPTTENPNPTGSQFAVLEPDATITITETSEIFADGDVWSYDFTLNVHANAHLFGTAGDIHGSRLHEQINKRKARLWTGGVPLHLGYLKLGDEAEVDAEGNVDVSIESGQKTFDELIEGAKANQVPMMDDVLIGMALWRKRWTHFYMQLNASAEFSDGSTSYDTQPVYADNSVIYEPTKHIPFGKDEGDADDSVQPYPRMVFPRGTFFNIQTGGQDVPIDCLNMDYPYDDAHPFCNVPLCYQRYDYKTVDEDGRETIKYDGEPEAQRDYEYMPADRVNSAPNFYVIYWLRCLMKHLGIHIEENQMMDVEDLRRLFFVNTNCDYVEPKDLRGTYDSRFGKFVSRSNGRLLAEYYGRRDDGEYDIRQNFNFNESKLSSTDFTLGEPRFDDSGMSAGQKKVIENAIKDVEVKKISVSISEVEKWSTFEKDNYEADNSLFFNAFATSDCFPNVDISEVIKAIESGFGVRLLFSNDYKRVRIVLLRNVFRDEEVQDIACEILDGEVKVENNKRGFRMTYGDNKENTHFYYKGFADMLPHKKELWVDDSDDHDYSHWNLDADYGKLINSVSAFDKTCYVTPNTGNAFGFKVDKDAKKYIDLHPSLFGFADFMDAEDGDCTGKEETIETINVGFTPAIMNDLNMEQERAGTAGQRFALFVDEQMRVRRPDLDNLPDETRQPGVKSYDDPRAVYDVDTLYDKYGSGGTVKSMTYGDGIVAPGEFAIQSDMYVQLENLKTKIVSILRVETVSVDGKQVARIPVTWDVNMKVTGHITEGYRLYLQDNFEPNDTGISPIETHDWGLTLGIMRGSGSDAHVRYFDDPDDDENGDNDTWEIVPGDGAIAHPDTCDSYGNEWDYNGSEITTKDNAQAKLHELFPHSNAYFQVAGRGYVIDASRRDVTDGNGVKHSVLFAYKYSEEQAHPSWYREYAQWLTKKLREEGAGIERAYSLDLGGNGTLSNVIIEVDTTPERSSTMLALCRLAYASDTEPIKVDNGVGSRYGRFSLKLRAEKPNPYYDPKQPESDSNRRYLQITNPNLRQRGLCDQFYKEYSKFIREARIVKRPVRMTLAQLLTIDKTKRVRVGDVTGFIRKMQYSVSNETGLGNVVLEIMYI